MPIICLASAEQATTFYYDNGKEITVINESLTYEEKKMIADYIAYGITPNDSLSTGEDIQTPLLCTLFGHNLTTTYVREITHNVYTESPKCVRNEYECVYCTRSSCDYIVNTLITSVRIATCHG